MNVLELLPVVVVVSLFLLLVAITTSTDLSRTLKARYNAPLWRTKLWFILGLVLVLFAPATGTLLIHEWNCHLPFFSFGLLALAVLIPVRVNLRRLPRPDGLSAGIAQSLTLCAAYCIGTVPALLFSIAAGALGPPGCS
jgi:hypothetical protein